MDTAGTVVLSIAGFIAFFYVNLYAGSFRMRRAATAFMARLQQRRFSEAYALMSSAFRVAVPEDQFELFLAQRGVYKIKEFKRYLGDFSIGSNRGTMAPWLIREDGVYFKVKLNMFRERMKWTVSALDAELRLVPAPMPVSSEVPEHLPPRTDERHEPKLH